MEKHITSLQHPLVKHLVKLREKRSYRYDQLRVLIEGHKMVREVSNAYKLLLVEGVEAPKGIQAEETYYVSPAIMKKISSVESPEGIMAEVSMPSLALEQMIDKRRLLILEGVKDPGNIGTLIRTALAMAWEGIILLDNSCDPFNDKALRAAKGATFRLPLAFATWDELQNKMKGKLLVADLHGEAPESFSNEKSILLLLGSESQGVSSSAKRLGTAVTIPMPGPMESLNVSIAGAILLYVLNRGRHD